MTYFIENKDEFLKIRAAWKNYCNNGGHATAPHMMLYNILRSKPYDRGFTSLTKEIRLRSGHDKWQGLKKAANLIRLASNYGGSYLADLSEPFGETINKEVIDRAWALIKDDQRLK